MAHHVETFVYSPLRFQNSIRLVSLQPAQLRDEVECELIEFNGAEDPEYEALSYEWGPPSTKTFWIVIDGKQYQIRENLGKALRCLRLDHEPRTLWIDALCINQEDTYERQFQVAQMGTIYRNAKKVVIWVGPEMVSKSEQQEALLALSFLEDTKRRPLSNFIPTGELKKSTSGYDETWSALSNFCRRSYWTRLWIIQEVVLARKAVVYCGEMKFTWGVLTKFFTELNDYAEDNLFEVGDSLRDSVPARLDRQRLVRMKREQEGSPVLDLMFVNEDAKCSDIRDKVWGIHSLIKPCCCNALPIDYVISPIELCAKVLHHHFLRHESDSPTPTRIAQRLFKVLFDDDASAEQWSERREALLSMEREAAEINSLDPSQKCWPSDSSYIQLSGRVRGRITWFGPHILYTHWYRVWDNSTSNPFEPYDKYREIKAQPHSASAQQRVDELKMKVYNPPWPYSCTNDAILAVLASFTEPGKATPRCCSISSIESYASVLNKDQADIIESPSTSSILSRENSQLDFASPISEESPNGLVDKVLSRLSITAQPLQRAVSQRIVNRTRRSSSVKQIPNEMDGQRILALENGLVAFAPKDAQLGDLVCHFKRCDFFVIIRPACKAFDDNGNLEYPLYKVVGTAGLIRKPADVGTLEQERVLLNLDIVTLLKLCWDFPWKNKM